MILPILSICAHDLERAEALLDWLALLKGKVASGHILLAFTYDVHEEHRIRLKISAEIGFSTVDIFSAPLNPVPVATKVQGINQFYQATLQFAGRNYRGPFLLLEPDCVMTAANWLEFIAGAYEEQPKLYLGSVLADPAGKKCVGRVGVYPRAAALDIGSLFGGEIPFEIAAGEALVARTTKTRLIQVLPLLETDHLGKVRPDALIVHGDKNGLLLDKLREEWGNRDIESMAASFDRPNIIDGAIVRKTNGVLPISQSDRTLPDPPQPNGTFTPKLDGRSKAARLLKAQAKEQGHA